MPDTLRPMLEAMVADAHARRIPLLALRTEDLAALLEDHALLMKLTRERRVAPASDVEIVAQFVHMIRAARESARESFPINTAALAKLVETAQRGLGA